MIIKPSSKLTGMLTRDMSGRWKTWIRIKNRLCFFCSAKITKIRLLDLLCHSHTMIFPHCVLIKVRNSILSNILSSRMVLEILRVQISVEWICDRKITWCSSPQIMLWGMHTAGMGPKITFMIAWVYTGVNNPWSIQILRSHLLLFTFIETFIL